MKDYAKAQAIARERMLNIHDFITNGSFTGFLIESFRQINFGDNYEIEKLLGVVSFYAGNDSSIIASMYGQHVSLYLKWRDMKYFVERKYNMIDNFDLQLEEFASKIIAMYMNSTFENIENCTAYYVNESNDKE